MAISQNRFFDALCDQTPIYDAMILEDIRPSDGWVKMFYPKPLEVRVKWKPPEAYHRTLAAVRRISENATLCQP